MGWILALALAAPDLVVVGVLPGEGRRAIQVTEERVSDVTSVGEARRRAGPDTAWLQAPVVTAGFVDAHVHPSWEAAVRAQVDLRGAPTYAEALARVADGGGVGPLVGHGWDQEVWPDVPEGGWPLAADLARVAPGRTVVLTRVDGHAVWVSPDRLTSLPDIDPPGGRIVRDAGGAPTGVLIDAAIGDATAVAAPPDARALREALASYAARGLTGVHAMGVDDAELAGLTLLAREGRLPVRVRAWVAADSAAAGHLLEAGPWREGRLAVVGVKHVVDGALGSRGAWLHAPYADAPETAGLPAVPADLAAQVAVGLRVGVSAAVHAIGDAAVDATLDAFASARAVVPEAAGVPLRIEHAQVLSPGAAARFAALGIVASMQPVHATSDMAWAEARLGPDRLQYAYAWRSLVDAGVTVALGSDSPVESADPGLGLWAAVTRTDLEGAPRGGWLPGQRLRLAEAVAGYTVGAAAAAGEGGGRVLPGAVADLTLWAQERGRWRAVGTVVAGAVVWTEDRPTAR